MIQHNFGDTIMLGTMTRASPAASDFRAVTLGQAAVYIGLLVCAAHPLRVVAAATVLTWDRDRGLQMTWTSPEAFDFQPLACCNTPRFQSLSIDGTDGPVLGLVTYLVAVQV